MPSPNPLAVARVRANLTQADLEQRTGVHQGTISNLERGHAPESLRIAFKLARVLGVPVDQLFDYCAEAPMAEGRRGRRGPSPRHTAPAETVAQVTGT
jgi:putative transcriptional regulator